MHVVNSVNYMDYGYWLRLLRRKGIRTPWNTFVKSGSFLAVDWQRHCCFSVVMFCYAAQEQHKQTSTTNESISNTIELSLPRSLLWISPWRTYKWKIRLRWGSVWKLVHIHFHAALCILELRWGKGNFWVRQFIISVIFFSHLISLKAYWINCVLFTGVENLKQTRHILK